MRRVKSWSSGSWGTVFSSDQAIAPTTIGQGFDSTLARQIAALMGFLTVFLDLLLVWRGENSYLGVRALLPLMALVTGLILSRGDLVSLGLVSRNRLGLGYWIKATLVIGLAIGTCIVVAAAAFVGLGAEIPIHGLPLSLVPSSFVRMCFLAPLIEEATYRLAFCTAAMVFLSSRMTIALSGFIFAFLHVLYGNPGPDNTVAGFFLAWAFLRSGSILVPILLHSLGNLCVLVGWVVLWYGRNAGFLSH